MTELQGHEDRLEISADSSVFVRSREEGSHGRSRVGGSAPPLCQRARCYQSRPWDLRPRPAQDSWVYARSSTRASLATSRVRPQRGKDDYRASPCYVSQHSRHPIPFCLICDCLSCL